MISFTSLVSNDVSIPTSPKDLEILVPYFRPDFETVWFYLEETQNEDLMSLLEKEIQQSFLNLQFVPFSAVLLNFKQDTDLHGNTNEFQVVLEIVFIFSITLYGK